MTRVQRVVEAEAAERRARNFVLGPITALCVKPGPFSGLTFPPRTLPLLWRALIAAAPEDVAAARRQAEEWRSDESSAEIFDSLCRLAAAGLRSGEAPFAAATASADAGVGHEVLAACLDIAPVTRRAMAQLPDWLGRMTSEKAAKLRLMYRDVAGIAEDAGPRFFEMLAAHLTEPWLILRIISGVMDRPNETYVSSSELASFGERVLADIDRRVAEITAFNASAGRPAAHATAQSVHFACVQVTEFDQSIMLTAEGVWGRRIARQKRALAGAIETHLKASDDAVARALPLQTVRHGPRGVRAMPRLTEDPDKTLVERAATLLTFMSEVRSSAAAGGFASARAKVLEAIDARLDSYVEDILEEIRSEHEQTRDRARLFMDIAAEFCGLARDEKAAQIVRRRAAAA
jgi:hypothetical protein